MKIDKNFFPLYQDSPDSNGKKARQCEYNTRNHMIRLYVVKRRVKQQQVNGKPAKAQPKKRKKKENPPKQKWKALLCEEKKWNNEIITKFFEWVYSLTQLFSLLFLLLFTVGAMRKRALCCSLHFFLFVRKMQ